MSRSLLQHMRAASFVLALAALVFKAMLPPGFMLDVGADRVAITLCSGGTLDLSHDGAPAADPSQHCPFAVANAPALDAPPALELAAPLYISVEAAAPHRAAAGAHNHTGPPLPARGPPLQA